MVGMGVEQEAVGCMYDVGAGRRVSARQRTRGNKRRGQFEEEKDFETMPGSASLLRPDD